MTPKDKAKELIVNFSDVGLITSTEAKQCALIAVDEILDNNEQCLSRYRTNYDRICIKEYWLEVKQEIEKL